MEQKKVSGGKALVWKRGLVFVMLLALLAAAAAGCGKKSGKADDAKPAGEVAEKEETPEEKPEEEPEEEPEEDDQDIVLEEEDDGFGIPENEEVSEEFMYMDENGNPFTEEDIANMDGDGSTSGIDGMGTPFSEYYDFPSFVMNCPIGVETIENLPFEVSDTLFLVYDSLNMYEIRYMDEDGKEIAFRKGDGTEDISGVYIEFEKTETVKIADVDVTMSGSGDEWMLATWNDGETAYSIYADPGYSKDTMTEMISALRASAQ